jgi:hypothetical protein
MPMLERHERKTHDDYAAGRITALEARRRLGDIGFGDLLRLLADEGLTLPQSPAAGRESTLARARAWLFPKKATSP